MTENKEVGNLADSRVENGGKLSLKVPSKRQEYSDVVDRCIETAFAKSQSRYCKNSERIMWMRCITGLVLAGVAVQRDIDIDELKREVEELKNVLKKTGNTK